MTAKCNVHASMELTDWRKTQMIVTLNSKHTITRPRVVEEFSNKLAGVLFIAFSFLKKIKLPSMASFVQRIIIIKMNATSNTT